MSALSISSTEIIRLDNGRNSISNSLLKEIRSLIAQVYVLPELLDTYQHFIDQGPGTELALFYGEYGDLAGFVTAGIHQQVFNMKPYALYQAHSLFSPLYHDSSAAAKFGLTHAMKYKLTHPEQILAFVGEAPTPMAYSHYSRTVKTYYPNPTQETPKPILEILEFVRKQRRLKTHGHSLCVSPEQTLMIHPEIVSLENKYKTELVEYYKQLNPDYQQGHSLLVYIPLDLANISLGLKNVISQPVEFSLS